MSQPEQINNKDLHQYGYQASAEEKDHRLKVVVRAIDRGKPVAGFPDSVVFDVDSSHDVGRSSTLVSSPAVRQEAAMLLARALCQFLNVGGSYHDLNHMVEGIGKLISLKLTNYQRVAVLPPSDGPILILKTPEGKYLKVVYGDEGFTEELSEKELLESFGEERIQSLLASQH